MEDVTITPMANGPYLVSGPINLLDQDGQAFTIEGDKIALCRCGASASKPFCDGTHKKIEFKDNSKAA